MTRSTFKGPYLDPYILDEIFKKKRGPSKKQIQFRGKKPVKILTKILKIRSRNSVIFPALVHRSFGVYNGIKFLRVKVKKSMVGHKIGEFAFTRRKHLYKSKRKGKKK
jgi:small subunit ribosomal protein S19